MKTDIYSIKDNETVLDALKFITNKKVSGVPVVNNKNKLVGFISDGDIIRYLSKTYPPFMGPYSFAVIDNDDKDFDEKLNIMMDLKVKNIIKKKVVTIDINTKIEDVCKILADNHLKKAPVTENGKMVGIINRSNITKYAVNSYLSLVK